MAPDTNAEQLTAGEKRSRSWACSTDDENIASVLRASPAVLSARVSPETRPGGAHP